MKKRDLSETLTLTLEGIKGKGKIFNKRQVDSSVTILSIIVLIIQHF